MGFVCRHNSKPGIKYAAGAECWTVHSTTSFAAILDHDLSTVDSATARTSGANELMLRASRSLLGRFFDDAGMPQPLCMETRRWVDASYVETLDLDKDGGGHNEAVSFRQWGLA